MIAPAALILGKVEFSSAQETIPAPPSAKAPSKVPTIVQLAVDQLERGDSLDSASSVESSQDGRLRLEFPSARAVGESENKDLEKLGAVFENSTGDILWPSGAPTGLGVITAWVPYQQVDGAAQLPWVVAVTPVEDSPPDAGSSVK